MKKKKNNNGLKLSKLIVAKFNHPEKILGGNGTGNNNGKTGDTSKTGG